MRHLPLLLPSVALALMAAFAPAALATPQADICYGPTVALGAVAPATDATVFSCPLAGNHTLPELAALGWQVVQLVPLQVPGGMADQLIIQHP